MGYSKVNNKQLSNEVVNPFAQELYLVSASGNGNITAIGIDSWENLGTFYSSGFAKLFKFIENRDNNSISVIGSNNNYIQIVDLQTRLQKYTSMLPTFNGQVVDAKIKGNYLIVVGEFTGYIKVFDLIKEKEVTGYPTFNGAVYCVEILEDGRVVCFGNFTNNLKVFNLFSKEEITGYPTFTFSGFQTGFNNATANYFYPISGIVDNDRFVVFMSIFSENRRTLNININTKTTIYNSSNFTNNTERETPVVFSGNSFLTGGVIREITTLGSIDIKVGGGDKYAVSCDRKVKNIYSISDISTLMYKHEYSTGNLLSSLSFTSYNSSELKCAIVTDLLKS